jgi:hypothetical protein
VGSTAKPRARTPHTAQQQQQQHQHQQHQQHQHQQHNPKHSESIASLLLIAPIQLRCGRRA